MLKHWIIEKSVEVHKVIRPKSRQQPYVRKTSKLPLKIEKQAGGGAGGAGGAGGGVGGGMSGMTTTGAGKGVITVGMGSYPKRRKKKKTLRA